MRSSRLHAEDDAGAVPDDRDPHAGNGAAGSLESLLEVSARHEKDRRDAPWSPHCRKQAGEPPRAPPSARRTKPLVEVVRADREANAVAAAEEWKQKHPKAAHLEHVPAHLRPNQPEEGLRAGTRARESDKPRSR